MGDQPGLPRVNEVAAFLNRFAPDTRSRLEREAPETAELLALGVWGGDELPAGDALRRGLEARAKVVDAALAEAVEKSRADIGLLSSRLLRLKRVRFTSLALGAIASSGVIATAMSAPVAAIIAAGIALAGNLAGVFADQLVLGPRVTEDSLRQTVGTLTRVVQEGGLTRKLLSMLAESGGDVDELKSLIADANRLFGSLIAAQADVAANS